MHKELMVLGLLAQQPMYGQQLRDVIDAHGPTLAVALKKPTMYYLLDRLHGRGLLTAADEIVPAPGPGRAHDDVGPRERRVYTITDAGRTRLAFLLREAVTRFEVVPADVDVAVFLLHLLTPEEAVGVLRRRAAQVTRLRRELDSEPPGSAADDGVWGVAAHALVADRMRILLDAELAWIARALTRVTETATA